MKYVKHMLLTSSLLLLSVLLTSCLSDQASQTQDKDMSLELSDSKTKELVAPPPATLPVQYQTAAYMVDSKDIEDLATVEEESTLKVGARITSTRGPQPLWDILKRLAALKGMNVSWSSDVDKNALVDVDINANDDFYEALDNMLRQVDYFHELEGNTIVVKYKETRRFQIAMPFTKQVYTTGTGGNVLGNTDTSSNVEGTIELKSKDNEFDIWDNIQLNIESIMEIWSYRREKNIVDELATDAGKGEQGARNYKSGVKGATATDQDASSDDVDSASSATAEENVSGGQGYYLIDKPVGLITVTAPRPVLDKIDTYISTLKKSLYKQISIEAKIIEVQLRDASSVGINWSNVLKNFNLNGVVKFGANGQIYPFIYNDDSFRGKNTGLGTRKADGGLDYNGTYFKTINPGQFISNISMVDARFDVFLNALNEQGDTKILSNPKLSVMNGQPSLITVGRNVTYVDSIESDIDPETKVISYSVNTERILSGVGMALTATVLGDDEVIMNLVPITSELQEPIEYRDVGNLGGTVGLPVVNVREMNTTVKVKDGEMLVIGGLISDFDESGGEFAPGLGDVPLLKYFFGFEKKAHIKRELIILLRPRII